MDSEPLRLIRRDRGLDTFELIADWRRFLADARGQAPATIRTYTHYLFDLQAAMLPKPLGEADERDLLAYIGTLHAQGSAQGAATRAMRSFYGWAFEGGYLAANPSSRIKVKKPREGPAPYLTRDEVTRLVVAAAVREPRRAWTILLMLNTGLRIGSAVHVRADDVREGILLVRIAKGDKPYSVPLNRPAAEAAQELTAIADERGTETLIGVGKGRLWQWFEQAGRDAGIHLNPHLLRHTFATWLAEANIHPNTIAELMNHGDLGQLLRRYVAVRDPVKRSAVEGIE